jgi:hypothetical protein
MRDRAQAKQGHTQQEHRAMTRPRDDEAVQAQAYTGETQIKIDLRGLVHHLDHAKEEILISIPLIDNNPLVELFSQVAAGALPDEDLHEQDNLANRLAEIVYRMQIERFFLRRIKER